MTKVIISCIIRREQDKKAEKGEKAIDKGKK